MHCVAGISRSVTVTVAYLMQRHRLSLNDAFALVRSRKSDVAPNFHFMRQLHCFERELGLDTESRSLSKVGACCSCLFCTLLFYTHKVLVLVLAWDVISTNFITMFSNQSIIYHDNLAVPIIRVDVHIVINSYFIIIIIMH